MAYPFERTRVIPFAVPTHLRQRSSVSRLARSLPHPSRTSSDDDLSLGDVTLPPSPPLMGWDLDNPAGTVSVAKKRAPKLLSTTLAEKAPLVWRTPPKGYPATEPKSLATLVMLGVTSLGLIAVILSALPSAPTRGSADVFYAGDSSAPCHPYSADGVLQVDLADPDRNRWHPRDPHCQAPNLFARLRFLNERYQRETVPATEFDWLRGKTVLLIGDAASREQVENFCALMGEDPEVIRPEHKWAPSSGRARSTSRAAAARGQRGHRLSPRSGSAVRDAGRPRSCYIPHVDLLLLSVPHYGFSQDEYWATGRHPQFTAPAELEQRISDVIKPLVSNIRRDGRPTAPDYIEFAPGAWDLARWAEQDTAAQQDSDSPLAPDRLAWFRHRLGATANRIQSAFPNARTKIWRTMYFPLDQDAETDYFFDKTSPRSVPRNATAPYFAYQRIDQINSILRSQASTRVGSRSTTEYEAPGAGFRVSEFGNVLKGHPPHQTDRLHGEPIPGSYVWADMMLYELRQAFAA
ncbi:hypothetical protein JCM3774_001680 [Rhodotorula dairenensis]